MRTTTKEPPVWPLTLLVITVFTAFFYLLGAGSDYEKSAISSSKTNTQTNGTPSPEQTQFIIDDESPESGDFDYIDYPIARFANGSVLYTAMGPADCPPRIENVEYIDETTLVITPKSYDENVECNENITTVVERITREDRNSIDRSNTDVIVINANIPESMLWKEPEDDDDRYTK